jgi:hypothetical protein
VSDPLGKSEKKCCVYYFSVGDEFSIAASLLVANERYDASTGRLVQPISMLIGQSLESYLKSYLSPCGVSQRDLNKKFGHDLQKLENECQKLGFSPSKYVHLLIDLFQDGHSRSTYFAFRYLNPDYVYKTFKPEILRLVLDILRKEMREKIDPARFLSSLQEEA